MILRIFFGYTAFVLLLFALVSALAGVKTALIGFGSVFSMSTLGILAFWGWEERQWRAALRSAAWSPLPDSFTSSSLSTAPGPDALASRAAALTERLAAVYPLIQREDLYKIIWMTMVEIYHEQAGSQDMLSRTGPAYNPRTARAR
ncbi:MAG: hypothetical protein NZ578_08865 [Candidatus Binatia bacterium]|nr:hypothetical protein [Candidatus Binatia bacterium]